MKVSKGEVTHLILFATCVLFISLAGNQEME